MITPAQCQAARKLLRMSINQLASSTGQGIHAILSFEDGTAPKRFVGEKLQSAFETAGAEFFTEPNGNPAVRLRSSGSTPSR